MTKFTIFFPETEKQYHLGGIEVVDLVDGHIELSFNNRAVRNRAITRLVENGIPTAVKQGASDKMTLIVPIPKKEDSHMFII